MKSRRTTIPIFLMILCFILVTIPVSGDTGSDGNTLTRGGRFTITITGTPNTPYYFWLANTYSMSGEPGDQPPVVEGDQYNVAQDPPGGPYTIGSYAYYNGNGRTIRDDVAPSAAGMPATNYYGKVTTSANGQGVVTFLTSSATATRSFSVKAENPASASSGNILVEEILYSRTTPPTLRTTVPTPAVTLTTPQTPISVPTTLSTSNIPPATPSPTPTRSDPTAVIALTALGISLWAAGRKI
jgi:hypothetical protein